MAPISSFSSSFVAAAAAGGAGVPTEAPTSAPISLQDALRALPSYETRHNTIHDRVFLTTNESLQTKTLGILKRQPVNGNTLIGVSGFFTLNIASVRGIESETSLFDIDTIIIVDRAPCVEYFWSMAKDIILSSHTAAETARKIELVIIFNADRFFAKSSPHPPRDHAVLDIEALRGEIASSTSWLSTDAKFAKIKRIFKNDRFIFKRMDLLEPKTFHDMATVLKAQGCVVDTLYISNVSEYVDRSPGLLDALASSVDHIAGPETLIVHTRPRPCIRCFVLEQRVMKTKGTAARALFKMPSDALDFCGGKKFLLSEENISAVTSG